MRINEVYEHEPILPYQGGESCQAVSGCDKVGTQCVDVSLPSTVTPVAGVGTVTTSCQGEPVLTCETEDGGLTCTLTVTQRVQLNVPVRFSAVVEANDDAVISCAGDRECGCML